jgi:hypothetical protein
MKDKSSFPPTQYSAHDHQPANKVADYKIKTNSYMSTQPA